MRTPERRPDDLRPFGDERSLRLPDVDFTPLIKPAGQASMMRDGGRLLTLAFGVVTAFVFLFSLKFGLRDLLYISLGVVFLGSMMWIFGTVEARLIEIRNVLGGSVEDGPDRPRRDLAPVPPSTLS